MHSSYTSTLTPIRLEDADGAAKTALETAQAQVGFIPNMYANMANLPGLREESGFSAQEQEVVFLVISRLNTCEYCVAAHSFLADTYAKVPADITNAIRTGAPVNDTRLSALAEFTQHMLESHGRPEAAHVARFRAAGFEEAHILGIILAISVKTLSNYANHLFHTELDEVFATRRWHAPG